MATMWQTCRVSTQLKIIHFNDEINTDINLFISKLMGDLAWTIKRPRLACEGKKNAYANTIYAKFCQGRKISSSLKSRLFPSLTALHNNKPKAHT